MSPTSARSARFVAQALLRAASTLVSMPPAAVYVDARPAKAAVVATRQATKVISQSIALNLFKQAITCLAVSCIFQNRDPLPKSDCRCRLRPAFSAPSAWTASIRRRTPPAPRRREDTTRPGSHCRRCSRQIGACGHCRRRAIFDATCFPANATADSQRTSGLSNKSHSSDTWLVVSGAPWGGQLQTAANCRTAGRAALTLSSRIPLRMV